MIVASPTAVAPHVPWRWLLVYEFLAVGLALVWIMSARHLGLLSDLGRSGVAAWVAQLTPLIAAMVVRRFAGDGLPAMSWTMGPVVAYVAILVGSAVFALVSAGLIVGFGWATLTTTQVRPASLILSTTGFLVVSTAFAFGEEFGWRGLVLPAVLPLGRLGALLMTIPFWFAWELPLVLSGTILGAMSKTNLGVAIGLHLAMVCSLAVIFGTLRLRFDSVILPALAHGALNTIAVLAGLLLVARDPILGDVAGPVGTGLAVLLAVAVLALGVLPRGPS
jgi:membrane protease YdiL (CAAX protease family)